MYTSTVMSLTQPASAWPCHITALSMQLPNTYGGYCPPLITFPPADW
jgi:hypothetical protein